LKTLFVTGAEGFVGSHLIPYLRQRGYEVVAGVRNRARKLALERNSIKALVCDASDAINVARAVASIRPDGVIHLAGVSKPAEAADEPLTAYQSIVTAWANVLDAVRRCVPRSRVLLVSGCDVYGNAGGDGRAISESAPAAPVSTFGSLKANAEQVAETYFRNYHLNLSIARPFHYTGANQPDGFYFGSAAQRIARWSGADGNVLRLPDLDCRRDLMHVDDVLTAYERILLDGKPRETYNVCSGQSQTCREIIQWFVEASGHSIHLADEPEASDPARIESLCGDRTKMREQLKWEPTRSARDAIRDLFDSCRKPAAANAGAPAVAAALS
jgi:GDP-4-dehydro-6-deoxy-D-mannose reductase